MATDNDPETERQMQEFIQAKINDEREKAERAQAEIQARLEAKLLDPQPSQEQSWDNIHRWIKG